MAMEACWKRRRGSGLTRLVALLLIWTICQVPHRAFSELIVTQTAHNSHLRLSLPPGVETRLLNFSPARKILIKMIANQPLDTKRLLGSYHFPETSGLMGLRLSELGANSYLLVVELVDRLEFTLQSQSGALSLEVADEPFHNLLTAWYLRGLYYQRAGDLGSALQYYRKIVFRNRSHPYAYFKAGQIRMAWGQYRLAEINFNKALHNQCDSTGLYRDLARLYEKTGRAALATRYRQKYQQHVQKAPLKVDSSPKKSENDPLKIRLVEHSTTSDSAGDTGMQTLAASDKGGRSVRLHKAASLQPADRASARNRPGKHKPMLSGQVVLLIGLAFASILMGLVVFSWLRRLNPFPAQKKQPEPELDMDAFLAQKMRLLNLASEAGSNEPLEATNGAPLLEAESEPEPSLPDWPVSPGDVALSPVAELGEQSAPLAAQESKGSKVQRLARELNVPAGELELAVNLSAGKTDPSVRAGNPAAEILKLYQQHVPVAEIARKMNLGQNEVELYLKFHNALMVNP